MVRCFALIVLLISILSRVSLTWGRFLRFLYVIGFVDARISSKAREFYLGDLRSALLWEVFPGEEADIRPREF